jgi:hypothetical protein
LGREQDLRPPPCFVAAVVVVIPIGCCYVNCGCCWCGCGCLLLPSLANKHNQHGGVCLRCCWPASPSGTHAFFLPALFFTRTMNDGMFLFCFEDCPPRTHSYQTRRRRRVRTTPDVELGISSG